jgi:hypothetical protein
MDRRSILSKLNVFAWGKLRDAAERPNEFAPHFVNGFLEVVERAGEMIAPPVEAQNFPPEKSRHVLCEMNEFLPDNAPPTLYSRN